MLRKDSERRATLHRVLSEYITLVVLNIQESVPQVGEEESPQVVESATSVAIHYTFTQLISFLQTTFISNLSFKLSSPLFPALSFPDTIYQ